MNERLNKTSICSIIFLDIVGYSQKTDADQIAIKDRFNAIIAAALQNVPKSDCIILDTGDGAGISLMGAPEEALFAALTMRDGFLKDNESHADPLLVRIGINLGPVRVVKDINERPNIIGDGINVAQRVMSFAEPNQILVSRSYYEMVSRLSSEMVEMFSYSGIKADKHVREHEVYAVASSGGGGGAAAITAEHIEPVMAAIENANNSSSSNNKLVLAALAVVILLLVAIAAYMVLVDSKPAPAPVAASPAPVPAGVAPTPAQALPAPAPVTAQKPEVSSAKAPKKKPTARKQDAEEVVPESPPPEDYGPGYLTKDASGQQVILYGDAADEARARDKAKRNAQ